jgi:peptide/nickel transport system ATP-binding protein
VLLADEPVSMLDVSIRLEMLSLLDDLRQRLSLAMLYITHDIASARYFADEVLVMYAGEIVERGPAEEVTQKPAHPYTQLLVASAPDPDNLGSTLRRGANGTGRQGPQQIRTPEQVATTGCPFSSRCPLAEDRCRQEDPALLPITATRAAACWRLDAAAPELVPGLPGSVRTTEN